ncbi:protein DETOXIFICATION 16-like [Olea europaea var. sylvestris]|uniref:protein DETOXIFICATION 16-like n=1 Tax=Olea europaea var. sylvestris TaxID=158386 RepID=UPI000C1D72D0|nr:protein DETOXIFICATION 16-like [Olea europaea var. sylvestris]
MAADNQTIDLEKPLIQVSKEYVPDSNEKFNRDDMFAEAKKQIFLAGPMMFVNLLLSLISTISVMFVGHVGELALSGASMATSFASVTGFSLLVGMACALDTFCGQSYGAKQYHMLGIHMQRAMLVLLLVSIPLAGIWAATGHILVLLGQDPQIAAEAGTYALYMIPSIFPFALLQCQFRFLQTQNNVVPMMLTSGITTLCHIPICWLLISKLGLGSIGAALANGISYWTNDLFLALYIALSPSCKNTWTGFSKEATRDVLKFLWLAVPSAIMVCLEIWSYEMMVLLAGLLPNPTLETSVLSISLNTNGMIYMIPLGLGSAISVRISNELGAGQPKAARLAVFMAVFMVAAESIVAVAVIILGRKIWGYCFSSEARVISYVSDMMILIAVTNLVDGVLSVLNGIARGCGWQKIGAVVNLGSFYIIGIPLGILLAFTLHLGGKGLWTGIIAAVFAQTFFLSIITFRTNWEAEAKKASTRVFDSTIPVVG